MTPTIIIIVLNVAVLIGVVLLLTRKDAGDDALVAAKIDGIEKLLVDREKALRDEFSLLRAEMSRNSKDLREEIAGSVGSLGNNLSNRLMENAGLQKSQMDVFAKQLERLTASNEERLDKMRQTLSEHLAAMQRDNSEKLEGIRKTVDEKLHETLETRLGESFKIVSERLETVHRGLGEMQAIATGVGDLKRVLSNVKTRGVWGEIRLGAIVEEILIPDQYERNVVTKKGSSETVEYAIKLPGKGDARDKDKVVWLPIDAKFPQEDYLRLVDAHEKGDLEAAADAHKKLAARLKEQARTIRDKYLNPPDTTDFAVMFLPTESLFAEALRFPALCEDIQNNYRVTIAGPTTLGALLNSLSMGFKTLAVEKRSSEVWKLLSAVKAQFGKFSELLDMTSKKLQEAGHKIEDATKKSRHIEGRLRKVEELPQGDADKLLGDPDDREE